MNDWIERINNYFLKENKRERVYFKFKFCRDEPETITDKTVFIIGERPNFWKVCFKCPCGCNEVISLNLLKKASPCWRFSIRWSSITIYPSIWRRVGCKSHFYIRRGQVRWVYL